MMSVVVTGARGFLGQHVVAALQARGVAPRLLGREEGDLLDQTTALRLLRDADVILHLAAEVGGVEYLGRQAARAFHANHRLGLNVIAAACRGTCHRLVLIGSPCSYGPECQLPLVEDDLVGSIPAGETGSYGFAKLTVSATAEVVCAGAGVEVVTAIPSNLYGPGDHFETSRSHVVAALLRRAVTARLAGRREFDVWGSGAATRDFVFVADAADAIAALAVRGGGFAGETINLGSGQETSIRQAADLVAKVVGGDVRPVFTGDGPVGYTHRVMSITRAKDMLGYMPRIGLEQGLVQTLAWIRAEQLDRAWLASDRIAGRKRASGEVCRTGALETTPGEGLPVAA
jgi:GDP-L-fucose synthase